LCREEFTEEERGSSERYMVLSKLLAGRMFPGENPIGQRVSRASMSRGSKWLASPQM